MKKENKNREGEGAGDIIIYRSSEYGTGCYFTVYSAEKYKNYLKALEEEAETELKALEEEAETELKSLEANIDDCIAIDSNEEFKALINKIPANSREKKKVG